MSSLSATQTDGYDAAPGYYDGGQHKKTSRNQLAGSEGHTQYLQRGVVRFKSPYDGFCMRCSAHVSRGTGCNAEKSKAGAYLTSPIYEFRMKCRICAAVDFMIRTNPKERCFDYVSGIHRQVREFDTATSRSAGAMDTRDGNRLVGSADTNSLAQLETVAHGKRKAVTERDAFDNLMKLNNNTFGQDVSCNAKLRSSFRKKKKSRLKKGAKLGWSEGMKVLDDDRMEDVLAAKSTMFADGKRTEQRKFRGLRTDSIFSQGGKQKSEKEPTPDDVTSRALRTGDRSGSYFQVKKEARPDGVASNDRTIARTYPQLKSAKKRRSSC